MHEGAQGGQASPVGPGGLHATKLQATRRRASGPPTCRQGGRGCGSCACARRVRLRPCGFCAGRLREAQASDRSYVEERVPLPEGLPFVADLAIDETGALLVVAQDVQRTMAALCRQDADGSWQRTKEVDAAAVAGQDASMPAVAMTPQGKLVGVVMPSDGTAAFLCTADGEFLLLHGAAGACGRGRSEAAMP